MIAMQFGDHCWLKGLQSNPELNDAHVTLYDWNDDKQRWRCRPVGWDFGQEFIAVRPKNLSNEPPDAKVKSVRAREDDVRERLAQNVAAMAVAEQQAADASDEEADRIFDAMEKAHEEKLMAKGFAELSKHWPSCTEAQEALGTLRAAEFPKQHLDSRYYIDQVHSMLLHMFDQRHDPATVRKCGQSLYSMGGFTYMQSNWYNYQKVLLLAGRAAGWNDQKSKELWKILSIDLSNNWDGIGKWKL